MQELGTITLVKHPRITVRISSKSLSFAVGGLRAFYSKERHVDCRKHA